MQNKHLTKNQFINQNLIYFYKILENVFSISINDANIRIGENECETPIYNVENKTIFLCINGSIEKEQLAYQFAHEFMHHIIYKLEGKTKEFNGLESKAQEVLCTAFSYYFLDLLGFETYKENEIRKLKQGLFLYSDYCVEIMEKYNNITQNKNIIIELVVETIKEWDSERSDI